MNTEVPPDSSSNLDLKPGKLIAGRFEICGRIGSGGMGMVYRAIDRELEDDVALKLLHPHLAQDETVFRRFRNEVLVARSLSHPNIVRTHDIGKTDDGYSYISMELVKGVSLKEYLVNRTGSHQEGGEYSLLPFKEAASIYSQILSGINYAHAKGVIHRDLKPANVMIDRNGEVKLADFGTARILGMDTSITRTGQLIGTPDYMAPEQIRGEKLDQSCDIYSLGIIAYELVTGARPFAADTAVAVAFKHLNEPMPQVSELAPESPAWFQQLVDKAAAKSRDDRFSSVADLGMFLVDHMSEMGIDPGFFSIEGTHFFSPGSSGVNSRPNYSDSDKTSLDADVDTAGLKDSGGKGSSGFSLGDKQAKDADTWTLDYAKEELAPEKDSVPQAPAKQDVSEQKSSTSLWGFLLVFLVFGLAGLGLAVWPNSPFYQLAQKEKEGGVELTQKAQSERELLHSELLDFAKQEDSVSLPEKGPAKTGEKTKGGSAVGKIPEQKAAVVKPEQVKPVEVKPEVTVAEQEKSAEKVVVKPEQKQVVAVKEEIPKPLVVVQQTPAPIIFKPVSGSFVLKQGGEPVPVGASLMSDKLRKVFWNASLLGISKKRLRQEKRKLSQLVRLNVYEPKEAKVIARLRPQRFALADSDSDLSTVAGNLGGVMRKSPKAGSYRLDLIYDGEVLDSREISLSVARVSFTRPASNGSGRSGAGGQVAIVRGPSYRDTSQSAQATSVPGTASELPREQDIEVGQNTNTQSTSNLGQTDITPQPRIAPLENRNPNAVPVQIQPGDSSAFPPARTFQGQPTISRLPSQPQGGASVSTLNNGNSFEQSVGRQDSYVGTLSFATGLGGPSEQRALKLNLRFNGAVISGSATVAGLNPFRVKGRVYPRGIELMLQGTEMSLRLTAVRRDRSLRGTYIVNGSTQRGSWRAKTP